MPFLKIIKFGWIIRRVLKAQRRSRKQINTELRDDLFTDTLSFMAQHQIHLESDIVITPEIKKNPLTEIEDLLNKLSSFENEYRLMENKTRVFEKTFLSALILSQGRNALDLLDDVNGKNKRISYYESKKNGTLDDLIDLWTKRLEGENENKVSHPHARREIEVRKLLAMMKKNHPQHINFYLLHFAEVRNDEYFKTELKKENVYYVINDILDFFEVGHATPDMIYKSIALQIFELFKCDIPLGELKVVIGHLLYYSFAKEYKNFTDFNRKGTYIKNIVGEFAVFDFDDEKTIKQKKRIGRIFVKDIKRSLPFANHPMFVSYFDLIISNPLKYRISRLQSKYFGFLPKNFSSYLPQ